MPRLALIHAEQRTGCCCGAEGRAEAVGRVAVSEELVGIERQREPAADVVTECDCAQQRAPAAAYTLGDRQRRRHHAAARMRERARVRIVGLVGVRKHAVGERCIVHRGQEMAADDASLTRAAQRLDVRNRLGAGQQP